MCAADPNGNGNGCNACSGGSCPGAVLTCSSGDPGRLFASCNVVTAALHGMAVNEEMQTKVCLVLLRGQPHGTGVRQLQMSEDTAVVQ